MAAEAAGVAVEEVAEGVAESSWFFKGFLFCKILKGEVGLRSFLQYQREVNLIILIKNNNTPFQMLLIYNSFYSDSSCGI